MDFDCGDSVTAREVIGLAHRENVTAAEIESLRLRAAEAYAASFEAGDAAGAVAP
jgi:hypothetical protein